MKRSCSLILATWVDRMFMASYIILSSLVTFRYMAKDFIVDQWDKICYPQYKKHKKFKRERRVQ